MLHRTIILGIALLCAPALSGCGFTPLYATDGPTAVAEDLARVSLISLAGPQDASRFLEASLNDAIGTAGETGSRYNLAVNLREQRRGIAVTVSANTRRFDYYLFGNYTLTDTKTGQVHKQKLDTRVSYAIVESQYASYVGRKDAIRRASEELARKIEFDIALYMKGRAPKSTAVPLPRIFGDELIEGGLPEEEGLDNNDGG